MEKGFLGLEGSSSWFVNFRTLEHGKARTWLNEDRKVRWQSGFQLLNALNGFDAMLYFHAETPGRRGL